MSNPLFKHYDELNDSIFEVEKMKKKVVLDLPSQIGVAVYSSQNFVFSPFGSF